MGARLPVKFGYPALRQGTAYHCPPPDLNDLDFYTLDYETYYDDEYSLSKMDCISYVLDPRFELQYMCVVRNSDNRVLRLKGIEQMRAFFRAVDWSRSAINCHNGFEFDHLITSWIFGVNPRLWIDTLVMSRPWNSKTIGNGLEKLSEAHGLPVKKSHILKKYKGYRLNQYTPHDDALMLDYCAGDTTNAHALMWHYIQYIPVEEIWAADSTCRMMTEPGFVVNTELVREAIGDYKRDQLEIMARVFNMLTDKAPVYARTLEAMLTTRKSNVVLHDEFGQPLYFQELDEPTADKAFMGVKKLVGSNERFAEMLRAFGVEPELKDSKTAKNEDGTPKKSYAFAKTDNFMKGLLEHENDSLTMLAEARISAKSTIGKTRLEKFYNIATIMRERFGTPLLPIPLKMFGADTTWRWSGYIYNPQNLPRNKKVNGKMQYSKLREAMTVPPGYAIVTMDLSGIELRVNHFLWKVPSSMEAFNLDDDADLYIIFASALYGLQITKANKDNYGTERQVGKMAQLGLGFGAAAETFYTVARLGGAKDMTRELAAKTVVSWRKQYEPIVRGWWRCNDALAYAAAGQPMAIDPWGMCVTTKNGIMLPNGHMINYPNLRAQQVAQPGRRPRLEWKYGEGRHTAKIYGGKIDENIVQALARDVIRGKMQELEWRYGIRTRLTVHDELATIVPETVANDVAAAMKEIFRERVSWWPELVLNAEGGVAFDYAHAK